MKTLVLFLLGLLILPVALGLILGRATPTRYYNNLIFSVACLAASLGWWSLFVLWTQRGYERRWQQFRARSWQQIAGRFDDGEVITMRKGRSGKVAGYQVWLGYDYMADGDQTGLYILPFVGEFPSKEVAEEYRKRAANMDIIVHVSPRNPGRSCVIDDDVRLLVREQK